MSKPTNTQRIEALEIQIRTLATLLNKVANTLDEVCTIYNQAFELITKGLNHLTAAIKKVAENAGYQFEEPPPVLPKLYIVPKEEEEE